MLKYTFYRVLQLIPVWILLSMVVFAIVHALPGDAIDALVPPDAASNPATRAALEKELGLDKPIYIQYLRWLERIVLHGDFGNSITTRRSIRPANSSVCSRARRYRVCPSGTGDPPRCRPGHRERTCW